MKKVIQKIGLAVALLGEATLANAQFSGGNGTIGNPYQIATKADLDTLSTNSAYWGDNFIQTADIMLTSADYTGTGIFNNGGAGFSPIGNSSLYFTGNYNGQGHIIDGLYINRPSQQCGLFGFTHYATIQMLGLTDVNITCGAGGSLVAENRDTSVIKECFATGTIIANGDNTGGLVGQNVLYSQIINCYTMVNVSGQNQVAGLVGFNAYSASINFCYAVGVASGTSDVGCLVGWNGYSGGIVTNSVWNIDTMLTGISFGDISGAFGRNTAAMQTDTTYLNHGWDFEGDTTNGSNDYWVMDSCNNNNGYPMLTWQLSGMGSQVPDNSTSRINNSILQANATNVSYQWMDCSNSTIISGATSQSFTIPANGSYAVILTSQAGCVDTSACVGITNLGIIENNIASLKMYPNPTSSSLTITTGKVYEELNIKVTDITGRVIATKQVSGQQKVALSIKGAKGIYFVHISNKAGKTTVAKVIKD